MTCILRALAVTALILAPGICAAAERGVQDDAAKNTTELAPPHHHKADTDTKTEDATDKRTHAETTKGQSRHGRDADDKSDMHPFDPHKTTAHMPGAKATTSTPEADAAVAPVPFHPFSHGPGSVIDKKTATAIGLLRPHVSKAGAMTTQRRPVVTPTSNGFRDSRTLPALGSVKTAVAARGSTPTPTPDLRAGTMTRGDNAMKTAAAIVPPRSLAAIHDAIISGTGVKRPATMMATIGGASVRKSTAVINGTDFRRKPH